MAASIWVKTAATLPRHPKTAGLCELLDISRAEAVGRLVLLWIYALEFRPAGIFENAEEVARAMDWPPADAGRLVRALRLCGGFGAGFVDHPRPDDNGRVFLHDWIDYTGGMQDIKNIFASGRRKREEKKKEDQTTAPAHSANVSKAGAPIVPKDRNHAEWLRQLGLLKNPEQ